MHRNAQKGTVTTSYKLKLSRALIVSIARVWVMILGKQLPDFAKMTGDRAVIRPFNSISAHQQGVIIQGVMTKVAQSVPVFDSEWIIPVGASASSSPASGTGRTAGCRYTVRKRTKTPHRSTQPRVARVAR